jgi:hypothetical protein
MGGDHGRSAAHAGVTNKESAPDNKAAKPALRDMIVLKRNIAISGAHVHAAQFSQAGLMRKCDNAGRYCGEYQIGEV